MFRHSFQLPASSLQPPASSPPNSAPRAGLRPASCRRSCPATCPPLRSASAWPVRLPIPTASCRSASWSSPMPPGARCRRRSASVSRSSWARQGSQACSRRWRRVSSALPLTSWAAGRRAPSTCRGRSPKDLTARPAWPASAGWRCASAGAAPRRRSNAPCSPSASRRRSRACASTRRCGGWSRCGARWPCSRRMRRPAAGSSWRCCRRPATSSTRILATLPTPRRAASSAPSTATSTASTAGGRGVCWSPTCAAADRRAMPRCCGGWPRWPASRMPRCWLTPPRDCSAWQPGPDWPKSPMSGPRSTAPAAQRGRRCAATRTPGMPPSWCRRHRCANRWRRRTTACGGWPAWRSPRVWPIAMPAAAGAPPPPAAAPRPRSPGRRQPRSPPSPAPSRCRPPPAC